MASVSSPGIGSGLDVNGIVTKLVDAEKAPKTKIYDTQEAKLQAKISAYGTLKSSLSSLQGTLSSLQADSTYQSRSTTIGDSSLFSATASTIADIGNHDIEVSQLAQAQSIASPGTVGGTNYAYSSTTDVVTTGGGTLTFTFGTTTFDPNASPAVPYSFTADSNRNSVSLDIAAGATISDVRDTINNANIGVSASLVDDGNGYRLVLKSASTGAINGFQVSASDSDGNNTDLNGLSRLAFNDSTQNMEQTAAGQDAQLKIDGLSISRDTNTVDGAIHGVTLNLLKADPGVPTTLAISQSQDAATKAVQGFVKALNDVTSSISTTTTYNTDTGVAGVLLGESSVRTINTQIRHLMSNPVTGSGLGAYRALGDIGISVQKDGSYSVDAKKLSAALAADPTQVQTVISKVAGGLDDTITNWLGKDGTVTGTINSLNDQVSTLNDRRTELNKRMATLQSQLLKQYTALDTLVATMKSTSDYLTQQLSSLPGMGGSSSSKSGG